MNNYTLIMYKIKREEVDEYIHNLNLHDISSVIQHIELGDELYLFKHKKQCIDYLKHLLDSGYTYKKIDMIAWGGIKFYGNDVSITFIVCNFLDDMNYTGCSIDKTEVFRLKENDDTIEFVKDKILNDEYIELQKQHMDYISDRLIIPIDTYNKDIYVKINHTSCEKKMFDLIENQSHSLYYLVHVFKNNKPILRISISYDEHNELTIKLKYDN